MARRTAIGHCLRVGLERRQEAAASAPKHPQGFRQETWMVERHDPTTLLSSSHKLLRTVVTLGCISGAVLLAIALFFDGPSILRLLRMPSREFHNQWILKDLATLRSVSGVAGSLLLISAVILWTRPDWALRLSRPAHFLVAHAPEPSFAIALILTFVVFAKTLLQLSLYSHGYSAYGGDDFSRSLNADYWLYHRTFDLGWKGWLGLGGAGWLPFPDYLFGFALALSRDVFLTPKIVNLAISGLAVAVIYWLGRELFGRLAGLLAAVIFAFQPWHVWLGVSGMTSDLPSAVLVALFGLYLIRWLRTFDTRPLVIAATFLAIANGFRYENWLFTITFSATIVIITVARWIQRHRIHVSLPGIVLAMAMMNAFPVFWMVASYISMGDWLPALHVSNAFLVSSSSADASLQEQTSTLATNQAGNMAQISMIVLALGSFPGEIALSLAGAVWLFRSTRSGPLVQYLMVLSGTVLLFAVMFKGRLPASIFYSRLFLPFITFAVPFAGYFLARLLNAGAAWRPYASVGAGLILIILGTLDVGRAVNYPDMFPRDGIAAGWVVRELQRANLLRPDAKILIERDRNWGDLAIVAMANRPERFVALNEYAYRRLWVLPGTAASLESAIAPSEHDDVRGDACDRGFEVEACRNSIQRERFSLVIVSSPERVDSFRNAYHAEPWRVGRFHIFDIR
jgi:hypothetical protein